MPKDQKDPKNKDDTTKQDAPEFDLQTQVDDLTKKLAEQEEIVKRAQSDYFRTKMEFDEYVARADAARAGFEIDGLTKALEKVLPFVNQLQVTIENKPEDLTGNSWAEGVELLYSKMLTDLNVLGVVPIEVEIGADPDYTLHIPIGMEEVEDELLKNKIAKIVEGGFVYEKGDTKKVIMPAKVIVGS